MLLLWLTNVHASHIYSTHFTPTSPRETTPASVLQKVRGSPCSPEPKFLVPIRELKSPMKWG